MRFLSWECWDFWRWHDHFRRFPKKSEVFRRRPKSADGEVIEKTLIHKIRDCEEGIVIYSFYTWFSFLTWVWVNIFLETVSSKTATTHIFQSGVRNWPTSVSRREIEVFNPQAWDSRLRRESWQVYEWFSVDMWPCIIGPYNIPANSHIIYAWVSCLWTKDIDLMHQGQFLMLDSQIIL